MAVVVRISRNDAGGPAIDHGTWAALDARLGGVGQVTRNGSLILAFDYAGDPVSAVEAALDTIPTLLGWRESLTVAPL